MTSRKLNDLLQKESPAMILVMYANYQVKLTDKQIDKLIKMKNKGD